MLTCIASLNPEVLKISQKIVGVREQDGEGEWRNITRIGRRRVTEVRGAKGTEFTGWQVTLNVSFISFAHGRKCKSIKGLAACLALLSPFASFINSSDKERKTKRGLCIAYM